MTTEDKLSFLDAAPADAGATATPAEPKAPEPSPAAPAAAAPAQQPETPPAVVAPPQAPKPEQRSDVHTVPLPKYLDTYNENRELKRKLAEFERQMQEREAQAPDPVTDPDGFAAFVTGGQQRTVQQMVEGVRLNMSEEMARTQFGDETVNAAFEALKETVPNDPFTYQRIMNSRHPWAEMVKWHQTHAALKRIGDPSKLDDWVLSEAERIRQARNPGAGITPTPVMTPQTPVVPPPSLSRAPSGGNASDVPAGPGQAFDSAFSR